MSESGAAVKFAPSIKFIVSVYIAEIMVAILLTVVAWKLSVAAP